MIWPRLRIRTLLRYAVNFIQLRCLQHNGKINAAYVQCSQRSKTSCYVHMNKLHDAIACVALDTRIFSAVFTKSMAYD
jgi:hypothetical protein